MNIKVEIDASGLFAEGESRCENGCGDTRSIKDIIRDEIIYTTKTQVLKEVSKDSIDAIKKSVSEAVRSAIEFTINGAITSEMSRLQPVLNGKPVDLSTFISTNFYSILSSRDFSSDLKKAVDNYVKTLKERYDIAFASTLLAKMKESGLLKDERIAELLIDKPKS